MLGPFLAQSPRFSVFCPGGSYTGLCYLGAVARCSVVPREFPQPFLTIRARLMQLPATSRLTPQLRPLRTGKEFQAAPPLLLAPHRICFLFLFFSVPHLLFPATRLINTSPEDILAHNRDLMNGSYSVFLLVFVETIYCLSF